MEALRVAGRRDTRDALNPCFLVSLFLPFRFCDELLKTLFDHFFSSFERWLLLLYVAMLDTFSMLIYLRCLVCIPLRY